VTLGAGGAPVLVLDASTYRATVAVLWGERPAVETTVTLGDRREERLMPAVAATLRQAGIGPGELGAVVCGAGPGGFTSLRIAAAIAKGIADTRGISLGAVPSLMLLAPADRRLEAGRYLASLDAFRGERFAALLEVDGDAAGGAVHLRGETRLVSAADLARVAAAAGAVSLGPGCALEAWPQASRVVVAAVSAVDPATWEPDYGRRAEAEVRRDGAAAPR
jgi:tRNA threonylcarbamoyladenosine biosynthesis protein TsaB